MNSPSITFLLTVPAVFLILSSCIALAREKRGKSGSGEMVLGAILMAVSMIGTLSLYYYSMHHQYQYEQDLRANDMVFKYLVKLMPLGLLVFAVGFTRYTGLLAKMLRQTGK